MKKITLIKGKRRFRTDDEILAKIDQCHTRAKGYQEQAEIKETQALDILRAASGKGEHEENKARHFAKILKTEAEKLRIRATRLVEVRAKALGGRLSQLRTHLLPNGGVTDPSVPAL